MLSASPVVKRYFKMTISWMKHENWKWPATCYFFKGTCMILVFLLALLKYMYKLLSDIRHFKCQSQLQQMAFWKNFYYFSKKISLHISKSCQADDLHEISSLILWKEKSKVKKKYQVLFSEKKKVKWKKNLKKSSTTNFAWCFKVNYCGLLCLLPDFCKQYGPRSDCSLFACVQK